VPYGGNRSGVIVDEHSAGRTSAECL